MSKITLLDEFLLHEIKDLHSAETQLTKALPRMAAAATEPYLKLGFETHLAETDGHVAR